MTDRQRIPQLPRRQSIGSNRRTIAHHKLGCELCEWAETVEDEILRSKVLIAFAFLVVAFRYPDRPLHRIARDSLASAGDVAVDWSMRVHVLRSMYYLVFDIDRAGAELPLADQMSGSPDDQFGVAFMNSAVKLFRGDHQGACHILKAL